MNNKLTNIESMLGDLVAIRSTTGKHDEVLQIFEYIENKLKGLPLYFTKYNDDDFPVLFVSTRQGLEPKTLLMAHADVLPAPASMFKIQIEENRLFGRGVWDMKFAIAGYLELFLTLGDKLKDYNVAILITSDEETRNKNITYMLEQGLKPQNVVLLDGAKDWQLETSSKGALTVKISVQGKAVHGSQPWEGESASINLVDIINKIREWFPEEEPSSDTLNISRINAGDAINQVPGTATAYLDMRFTNSKNQKSIEDKLNNLTKNYKFKWEVVVDLSPTHQDITDHYLREFSESSAVIASAKLDGLMSLGASEASHIIKAGIPCIVTRPKGGGHHSDNEWVDRKSLALIVPIIESYIKKLG